MNDFQKLPYQETYLKSPNQKSRNNTYKSYSHLLLIASVYQISFAYFGYIFMYFNSLKFQQLVPIFKITIPKDVALGVYSAIPCLGACIGSFCSKSFIEKYSRRQNLLICNALAIFAGILVLIPNMTTLFFGRLLQGICVGYYCAITPLIIKQLSPIQLIGNLSGLNQIAIGLGYVIGYVIGWISEGLFENPVYKYIFVFGFNFILIAINLFWVLFIFPYQTPKYLIQKGLLQEAKLLIQIIYKPQYQQQILQEKILQHKTKLNQISQIIQQFTHSNCLNRKKNKQFQSSWLAIVSGVFLGISQQMSGCNVLPIFTPQIARKYFPSIAGPFPMLINLQKLIVAAFATFFIFNRFERKHLIVGGIAVCSASLYCFLYGAYQVRYQSHGQIFILIGYVVYMFAFAGTLGPLTWVYISEVVQPNEISYVLFAKWVTSFVSVFLFPIVRQHTMTKDGAQFFLVLFLFTLVATFVLAYILVQTKDKNEIQIRAKLKQRQQQICEICEIC